jgi:hypothetical protein
MSGVMAALTDLRVRGQMTWSENEQGWVGVPEEILDALANDGFDQCKRETTTSHRDCRPAGGVWQGVNRLTGAVASAIWVSRPVPQKAMMFIQIDGEPISKAERAPDDEGGLD